MWGLQGGLGLLDVDYGKDIGSRTAAEAEHQPSPGVLFLETSPKNQRDEEV